MWKATSPTGMASRQPLTMALNWQASVLADPGSIGESAQRIARKLVSAKGAIIALYRVGTAVGAVGAAAAVAEAPGWPQIVATVVAVAAGNHAERSSSCSAAATTSPGAPNRAHHRSACTNPHPMSAGAK